MTVRNAQQVQIGGKSHSISDENELTYMLSSAGVSRRGLCDPSREGTTNIRQVPDLQTLQVSLVRYTAPSIAYFPASSQEESLVDAYLLVSDLHGKPLRF